jgi:hypothetical protein
MSHGAHLTEGMSPRPPTPPPKLCQRCGRRIDWRPRWAASWEQVRWCGERCRRTRLSDEDEQLAQAILGLLRARARQATICPSEAARSVNPDGWRALMEPARQAARRLVGCGLVEITQGGRVVDPSTARGPIRVRLRIPLD